MNENEVLQERMELAMERIREISSESFGDGAFQEYFHFVASFLMKMEETFRYVEEGRHKTDSLDELKRFNTSLYEDILPMHYENSYANPSYAVKALGGNLGSLCSFLYFEMRSLIGFAFEQRLMDMVIRMELFLELYGCFVSQWQEMGNLPDYETVRKIIYWYAFDYSDIAAAQRVEELVVTENNFAARIIRDMDLSDIRYLFAYGEYVTENEMETARFMAELPQDTIDLMADTYTEGYRMGFVIGNKDLSVKRTVDVRFSLGFERLIQKALCNFAKMGLQPAIYRPAASILHNPSIFKNGFLGASANKQYDFDHKDDRALFLDKIFVERKLEVLRTAYEQYKDQARLYAGPAVMETFGEKRFEPVNKCEALHLSREQQAVWVDYQSKAGQIQREYILEEERSFTIIAFPVPEIGEDFAAIFQEIIRINTLDYKKYQQIQQTLIDTLDQAAFCQIKGCNGNRTDLKVMLYSLKEPERETVFENCVADVNIPVGEVFTSPVLKGTNGLLNVSRVYLNELAYENLEITFEDGMIKSYTCSNFVQEEENQAFIRENLLFHHDTLPLGEFAIGTNTTAYVAARKFGIEDKLPILIAEKMGPHFAVGDTCYSFAEDVEVFNPDGKRIAAKENEVSAQRHSKSARAYFNCHTDITIPYDELGELTAVKADGTQIPIIENGRFVLEGCLELNDPLSQD